jgi:hypothetical protein
MNNKKILGWEIFGILFIFLLGAFFHFIYEISGFLKPIALIGAVNESVWEHLKIGFWPAFIWAIIEFFAFGKRTKNFFIAKGISFTLIGLLITGLFYAYTILTGLESLAIDISIFFVAIAVAQIISYRIMIIKRYHRVLNVIGVILILANLVAFSLLSYFPPKCPIFLDPVSGGYGIVK